MSSPTPGAGALLLHHAVSKLIRSHERDLSVRQLGVFLTCYLEDRVHTVRGLAAHLHIGKPAVTRALNRLGAMDLVRRTPDPGDRRSVVVVRTKAGAKFLRDLHGTLAGASRHPVAPAGRPAQAAP